MLINGDFVDDHGVGRVAQYGAHFETALGYVAKAGYGSGVGDIRHADIDLEGGAGSEPKTGAHGHEAVALDIGKIADNAACDGVGDQVSVDGGGVLSLPVRVRAERNRAIGIHNIDFVITATDDASVSVTEDSRFLGPTP